MGWFHPFPPTTRRSPGQRRTPGAETTQRLRFGHSPHVPPTSPDSSKSWTRNAFGLNTGKSERGRLDLDRWYLNNQVCQQLGDEEADNDRYQVDRDVDRAGGPSDEVFNSVGDLCDYGLIPPRRLSDPRSAVPSGAATYQSGLLRSRCVGMLKKRQPSAAMIASPRTTPLVPRRSATTYNNAESLQEVEPLGYGRDDWLPDVS